MLTTAPTVKWITIDKTNLQTGLMTFLGGGGWPQRHHASCIVRYICWLHSPTSTQSIKLQCTLVTKTIVNHLKPKKQRRKLPTPFRIWYIRYLIINYQYQHNHTFLFQWSIWQTLKVKTTESKQNINLYNGKNVCIKDRLRYLLEEECYCI